MRVLTGPAGGPRGTVTESDLPALYEPPRRPWLRANMVSSIDGAATGSDGRSGTLNNDADHAVFDMLRATADVVVVGAGTARAEGYGPAALPIVLVSQQGEVPDRLRAAPAGSVLLATTATSPGLAGARALLGEENVLVVGDEAVDLPALRDALVDRGWSSILCEGGPSLLGDLLTAGVVDELCLTVVPAAVGGDAPRIVKGPPVGADLELALLLEHDGTLLGRWFVRHP